MHGSESQYCTDDNAEVIQVAGHASVFDFIFNYNYAIPFDVFAILRLNKLLFQYAPYPEATGKTRSSNVLVVEGTFESLDFTKIAMALVELNQQVRSLLAQKDSIDFPIFILLISQIHHRLTVIHPFFDGNGRSIRAFTNMLLMARNYPPIFIPIDRKNKYLNALSLADKTQEYTELVGTFCYEIFHTQTCFSIASFSMKND